MWEPQVRSLSGEFRVVTVDLRGHGESDAPLWLYTMDQFADDVKGLLDHLAIQQAVLAGFSMGGYVVFAFYRKYADRKSTRLNSSHLVISYAVFCLKKKKNM